MSEAGAGVRRTERLVRYMRTFIGSEVPPDVTVSTLAARQVANGIYDMIDNGQLTLSIVDVPGRRFPYVTINPGDKTPDQIRLTICLDLDKHRAMCEVDRLLAGEAVGV